MTAIWYEEYRPSSFDDYIFASEQQEKAIRSYVENRKIPNLLFSGEAGTGKTSLVHCIINELDIKESSDVKIINTSAVTKHVEMVENDIMKFCRTLPMGDFKILVLEEFDRCSVAAQQALRNIIEEHEDRVRFIATVNYPHKLISAMHSRFQNFEFSTMDEDRVYDLVIRILEDKNINVEDPEILVEHVERYSPDIRKIINSIQQYSQSGSLERPESVSKGSEVEDEWEALWKSGEASLDVCRSLLHGVHSDNIDFFFRVMYENIEKVEVPDRDKAIVSIARQLYRSSFVADVDILLDSCLIQIFSKLGDE